MSTWTGGLSLGELRDILLGLPGDAELTIDGRGLGAVGSYRGFYDHVALSTGAEVGTVRDAVKAVSRAIGATFYGYKGGEYLMTEETPVWVSEYGEASERYVTGVMALPGGQFAVVTGKDEW